MQQKAFIVDNLGELEVFLQIFTNFMSMSYISTSKLSLLHDLIFKYAIKIISNDSKGKI